MEKIKFKTPPPRKKEQNSSVIQIKVILNMPFCSKASHLSLLAGFDCLCRNKRKCKGSVWLSQAPIVLVPLPRLRWVYSEFTSLWGARVRPLIALLPRNVKSGQWNLFCMAWVQARRTFVETAVCCLVGFTWRWPTSVIGSRSLWFSSAGLWRILGAFLPKFQSAQSRNWGKYWTCNHTCPLLPKATVHLTSQLLSPSPIAFCPVSCSPAAPQTLSTSPCCIFKTK